MNADRFKYSSYSGARIKRKPALVKVGDTCANVQLEEVCKLRETTLLLFRILTPEQLQMTMPVKLLKEQ